MQLIEKLYTIKNKKGHPISYGKFLCLVIGCNKEVVRQISNGLKAKSCGCITNELKSEAKLGIKNPQFGNIGVMSSAFGIKRNDITRQKMSIGKKGKYLGENNPFYGKKHTEEARQKQSKIRKEFYFGEFAPNWQGGISYKPYPQEFNKELKQQILERDNYTCQCPDCEHKSIKLDVHHIDYNKENNSLENLITLCSSCHGKTKGKNNRIYWANYYKYLVFYHK